VYKDAPASASGDGALEYPLRGTQEADTDSRFLADAPDQAVLPPSSSNFCAIALCLRFAAEGAFILRFACRWPRFQRIDVLYGSQILDFPQLFSPPGVEAIAALAASPVIRPFAPSFAGGSTDPEHVGRFTDAKINGGLLLTMCIRRDLRRLYLTANPNLPQTLQPYRTEQTRRTAHKPIYLFLIDNPETPMGREVFS